MNLVVDDASHTYEDTKASFETLFPLLQPGGIYAIEDWSWACSGMPLLLQTLIGGVSLAFFVGRLADQPCQVARADLLRHRFRRRADLRLVFRFDRVIQSR
jgi:hypothetical protein